MKQVRVGKLLVIIMGGLAAMGAGLVSVGPGNGGAVDRSVDFSRDIAPILSDRCFKCHGPDEAAREETGGLRLDSFEGATAILEDGGQAIVPGDPVRSLVMQRLRAGSERHRMPPPDSNLTISEDEIALIERWIASGEAYTKHWAFVPPVKAEVPEVAGDAWCRNEIDHFVLAELERRGIKPSPEADRATLLRRVYLDLTGLPPTPEQIDAFVGDARADAYERVVDELLASAHYGERMALMWLDVARYADTNGYHHDNERSQWPWRVWVIDAFNDNKPFDQFVVEQIGGDEIPDATLDQRIATGFCRNHPMTDEGGAIDEEYRMEYAADRVETMSNAFLALTMNCTRCHDHKFDPLTQEDYYSLFSFFNSTTEKGLYDRAQGDRDKAFPPFIKAPTAEQSLALEATGAKIADMTARMEGPIDGLDEQQAAWEAALQAEHAVSWVPTEVTRAVSTGASMLEVLDDGSVLATGKNPDSDMHELRVHTDAASLNLIALEVLPDVTMFEGRVGRAPNGNGVLSGLKVEAVSAVDPTQTQAVKFAYAWADVEQDNGDFDVLNVLRADDPLGWAVNGHGQDGPRVAIFVSDTPFGFEGGTDLQVTLEYQSPYAQHVFGRVRLLAGSAESVRAVLPVVERDWFIAAPFEAASGDEAFETAYGPESITRLDLDEGFGEGGKVRWVHRHDVINGQAVAFDGERRAFYLARTYFSPHPRQIELSLGSDDAIRVFLNGVELLANNARRGVAPDQEKLTVDLPAGESVLVVKIVNDGGPGGVYAQRLDEVPLHIAPVALLDEKDRTPAHAAALRQGYRERLSPAYRLLREQLAAAQAEEAEIESAIPNVMVMDELPEPLETFVLNRGQYDHPDKSRPVGRTTPKVLNPWPEGAPQNRYGLGLWLVSDDNPLTARVAVNRFWQTVFGLGLVKTADDFGMQGELPSHPALLDWLAVDFREHGWDVKRLVRQMVTSSTYRQSSVVRTDLAELDPENRLLARASRRRLPAELVRDNALAAAGLLNDEVGGASVRPYQPAGLWEERSMPVSNTRVFKRDTGDKLYRRGMYTFWKRSAPPPQMANFDAPTREYCVALRSVTNTPVQALTLMNDETYLEIARVLAARVWSEVQGDEAIDERLGRMFRLATGRSPETDELEVLRSSYEFALERYREAPEDAQALLSYGEIERDMEIDLAEYAALTIVANIVLNLDETVTRE